MMSVVWRAVSLQVPLALVGHVDRGGGVGGAERNKSRRPDDLAYLFRFVEE
jgi:hypothetical protein